MMHDIVIYHNTACGTSRNALALIRNARIEHHVIEYLKCPPSRQMLISLLKRPGITPRELAREKGSPFHELRLSEQHVTDEAIIDAMMPYPILINRPLVVSSLGVKLCRPSESVLNIMPKSPGGAFTKEDGERVINASGNRVRTP